MTWLTDFDEHCPQNSVLPFSPIVSAQHRLPRQFPGLTDLLKSGYHHVFFIRHVTLQSYIKVLSALSRWHLPYFLFSTFFTYLFQNSLSHSSVLADQRSSVNCRSISTPVLSKFRWFYLPVVSLSLAGTIENTKNSANVGLYRSVLSDLVLHSTTHLPLISIANSVLVYLTYLCFAIS